MNRSAWCARGACALALAALAACGPGGDGGGGDGGPGGPDAAPGTPVLVAGGGVTGGAIDGSVAVYVIDDAGGAPIAGAQVRIGAADAASPLEATTDGDGLARFSDPGLTGPQTVTATASGHAATTWIGVAGASATLPLTARPRVTPTAHVTGTIAGWDSLPGPSFGHYTLAVVLSSFTHDVSSPDNNLAQPTDGSGAPLDTCLDDGSTSTCAWQLTTRTGRQLHNAVIVDGDSKLTSDTSDDTYTLIGYAVGSSMTLTAGQEVSGESLTMVPGGQLTQLTVSLPSAPSGLGDVVAIPMLDLGADGELVFPLPTVTPGNPTTKVISPSGQLTGSYDLVALATPPGAATVPYSTVVARGVALGGATVDPWLAAPTQLSAGGGSYGFSPPGGAALAYATFTAAGGQVAWNVAVLDGTISFQLPALSPDPLGTGSVTLAVTAADIPGFDPGHFAALDLATALHRASGARTSFTR
jgi:Carboxypeptidase regulatory-like domain